MPLTAVTADGRTLIAPFLDDRTWHRLRRDAREVGLASRCCGNRMFARSSKLGTRHFVHHRRGDCTTAPETWQHLTVKAIAARVAAAEGWNVEVEAMGDGWTADVLARRDDRAIAVEVQWSSQTASERDARTRRYYESGIKTVWLSRMAPRDIDQLYTDVNRTLPLSWDDDRGPRVFLHGEAHTVETVLARVFRGELQWRRAFLVQQPNHVLIGLRPWACDGNSCAGKESPLPYVQVPTCCPSGRIRGPGHGSRAVSNLVLRAQARGVLPRRGTWSPASKRLRNRTLRGWRCPRCSWIQQMSWCVCCAGLDEPPPDPVAVWALRCSAGTMQSIYGTSRWVTGNGHWCTSRVDPRELA